MSAPRVLLSGVALAQPMGGVLRHNRELLPRLARLLAERGGSLAVLVGSEPPALELPAEVELLPSTVAPRPVLARALAESRALRAALERAAAAGRPFDLVHTAHLPAPRRLGVPFTLTLHDLKSVSPVERAPLRRLAGRAVVADALRRAARVLAVSAALGRELTERFGLPPERLAVVPNGADHLPVLPRRPGPAMLYVGHVEPRKHLEVVVRALALDPELPPLELAGAERGTEGRRLRALAAELGVSERLAFLGEQDDPSLARLYAQARCVVLPSRREGFGIPALEAQRAGAPLAISNLPALVEVAGDETPRFDPDSPPACARALHAALEMRPDALARAARRASLKTWDHAARAWLESL